MATLPYIYGHHRWLACEWRRCAGPGNCVMMTPRWWIGLGFSLAACADPEIKLCDRIPAGGCPIDRGGTCADQECAAIYTCDSGEWNLAERCEHAEGGGVGQGGRSPGVGGHFAFCEDLELAPSKGTCAPDLQEPDCPVAAASPCKTACTTGCELFFACLNDAWVLRATCEDGELLATADR